MSRFKQLRKELRVYRVLTSAKKAVKSEVLHSERVLGKVEVVFGNDGDIVDIEGAQKDIGIDLAEVVESFEEQIDLLTQAVAYAGRELCDKTDPDINKEKVYNIETVTPPETKCCNCGGPIEMNTRCMMYKHNEYYHLSCPPPDVPGTKHVRESKH